MTPADVLDRAADLIERDGWVQGWFGSPECGWCASGAIHEAAAEAVWSGRRSRDAWMAFSRTVGLPVARWNDAHDRMKDEVVVKLREVAVKMREVS